MGKMFASIIMEIKIENVMQDINIGLFNSYQIQNKPQKNLKMFSLGALIRVHEDRSVRIHPEY